MPTVQKPITTKQIRTEYGVMYHYTKKRAGVHIIQTSAICSALQRIGPFACQVSTQIGKLLLQVISLSERQSISVARTHADRHIHIHSSTHACTHPRTHTVSLHPRTHAVSLHSRTQTNICAEVHHHHLSRIVRTRQFY